MPIQTEQGFMLTYEDYVKIPEDGRRHEIIEGKHIVSPAPRTYHQSVIVNLVRALGALDATGRGRTLVSPVDVHLTEVDIVQPDVLVVASKSRHRVGELKIDGPPELVIEVLSASTSRRDRGAKRALYESVGVLEYWIVDPDARTVTQHELGDGRYIEHFHTEGVVSSSAFPGFELPLTGIW